MKAFPGQSDGEIEFRGMECTVQYIQQTAGISIDVLKQNKQTNGGTKERWIVKTDKIGKFHIVEYYII